MLEISERLDQSSISITETGCQIWLNTLNPKGYGYISYQGKRWLSHRLSWTLHNKQQIPKGKMILHSCDLRCCINPHHLRVGTAKSNFHDALKRNRLSIKQIEYAMYKTDSQSLFDELHQELIKRKHQGSSDPLSPKLYLKSIRLTSTHKI